MPDDLGVAEVHTYDGALADVVVLWERCGKVVLMRLVPRDGQPEPPHR